ncbi:MAG TPA: ABC transporter ATP-binding protein [Gemmatimonadales bacterium]|nr:ABC transporter ATP-binding protein [Gemmatimonadales bacterium]
MIVRILRPHWRLLSIAGAAVLVEGAADLVGPWPIKIVLDYVIGSRQPPAWLDTLARYAPGHGQQAFLALAVIVLLTVTVASAVSSYTEDYLTTTVGQRVMHDLRHDLYHHIQRLSLSEYDRQRTGDLISRITGDIEAIQDLVASALLGIVLNVLVLTGMIAIMFALNWRFTLVALAITPFLFLEVYSLTRRSKRATSAVRRKQGEVVAVAQESLSSLRVVQAFGQEDYEEERLERETLESIRLALDARKLKARLSPIVDVLVAIGTCLVLWYGSHLVLNGALTPGALVVFVLYLGKMYKPMRDLSKLTDTVAKALVGAERIEEIAAIESQVRDLPGARQAPRFRGEITLDHVRFGFDETQSVLTDVCCAIGAGQFVALVGPSGGGKSTVLSLIARFYDPRDGVVRIDGVDVRSYTLKSLRRQISFVLQDTILFRAPIWQNIAYGKPEASHEEIVRAARLANAHDFILHTPHGYETMVGERGVSLSGGERQRIAIARAIIRDAPILLLDEVSTGLDAQAEEVVFEALARLIAGRTTVVVSHRLATIRNADRIFVLDGGTIVESGTHEELVSQQKLYAQLHDIQLREEDRGTVIAVSRTPSTSG